MWWICFGYFQTQQFKKLTEGLEEKEQDLLSNLVKQLGKEIFWVEISCVQLLSQHFCSWIWIVLAEANASIDVFSEELYDKTEECQQKQLEISNLLSQLVDYQTKLKAVSLFGLYQILSPKTCDYCGILYAFYLVWIWKWGFKRTGFCSARISEGFNSGGNLSVPVILFVLSLFCLYSCVLTA